MKNKSYTTQIAFTAKTEKEISELKELYGELKTYRKKPLGDIEELNEFLPAAAQTDKRNMVKNVSLLTDNKVETAGKCITYGSFVLTTNTQNDTYLGAWAKMMQNRKSRLIVTCIGNETGKTQRTITGEIYPHSMFAEHEGEDE